MNTGNWRNAPAVVVGSAMAIVVVGSVVARVGQHIGVIEPRVRIEAYGSPERGSERATRKPLTPPALDGEVTRTTERLRELAAVMTALTLYVAGERLRGRTPGSVDDLLAGVTKDGLMPPGMISDAQPGVLTAAHSTAVGTGEAHGQLFERYRPVPFGIEVISVGREPRDGPALMMRVPADETNDEGAGYYMTTRVDEVRIPEAFAEESRVISAGWTRQLLRAVKVTREERGDLREWAGRRTR